MSWPYSLIKVVATGDLLTAADYNNEHTNHINNNIPSSIDDASATTTDFQTTADPYPSGGISLPTDLVGEIQRLRFQLALLTGSAWYVTTPFGQNIDSLSRNNQFHTHQGGTVAVTGSEFYYNGPTLDGTAAITPATITGASIAANTITGTNFLDGSITTAKLADSNVTTAKIAAANVTLAKLGTDVTAKFNPLTTNVNFSQSNNDTITQTFSYSAGPGRLHLVDLTSSSGLEAYSVVIDGVTVLSAALGTTAKRWISADGTLSSSLAYLGWEWSSSVSVSLVASQGVQTRTVHVSYAHN